MESKTVILSELQISQRVNRLAYQVYEDNLGEKEIVVAGIAKSGYIFAKKITEVLKKISPLKIELVEVVIDKHGKTKKEIELSIGTDKLKDKVIILVDDVLDSGKTMMYSLQPFLNAG